MAGYLCPFSGSSKWNVCTVVSLASTTLTWSDRTVPLVRPLQLLLPDFIHFSLLLPNYSSHKVATRVSFSMTHARKYAPYFSAGLEMTSWAYNTAKKAATTTTSSIGFIFAKVRYTVTVK